MCNPKSAAGTPPNKAKYEAGIEELSSLQTLGILAATEYGPLH